MSRASICVSRSTCADGLAAAAARSPLSSPGGGGVTSSTKRCRVHPPAFTTLVGLAMLGAGGSGDLRDLALGAVVDRRPSQGFIGRLVAAMKGGF